MWFIALALAAPKSWTLGDVDDEIIAASLSPDERWLAAGTYEGKIRVYDLEGGEPRSLPDQRDLRGLKVHDDGRVVVHTDEGLWLVPIKGESKKLPFPVPKGRDLVMGFSTDGKRFCWLSGAGVFWVVALDGGDVKQLQLEPLASNAFKTPWAGGRQTAAEGLSFILEGEMLSVRYDVGLALHDLQTGRVRQLSTYTARQGTRTGYFDARWQGGGVQGLLAHAGLDANLSEQFTVSVWTPGAASESVVPLGVRPPWAGSLAGGWALGIDDVGLRAFDLTGGKELGRLGIEDDFSAIEIGDRWMVVGSYDILTAWEVPKGRSPQPPDVAPLPQPLVLPDVSAKGAPIPLPSRPHHASAAGERVLLALDDGVAVLEGSEARVLDVKAPWRAHLAPTGDRAALHELGKMRVVDLATGAEQANWQVGGFASTWASTAIWASAGLESPIRVVGYDAKGRKNGGVSWKAPHGLLAEPVDVDAAGEDLVVARMYGPPEVFDASGKKRVTLRAPTGPANRVAAAPDGRHVAAAGNDRRVDVFDARSGTLLQTVARSGACSELAWSPDGKTLAMYTLDGLVGVGLDGKPRFRLAAAECGVLVWTAAGLVYQDDVLRVAQPD